MTAATKNLSRSFLSIANPYLDILSPFFRGLSILAGLVPVFITLGAHSAVAPEVLTQYIFWTKLGQTVSTDPANQFVSVLASLSDGNSWLEKANTNSTWINRFRALNLLQRLVSAALFMWVIIESGLKITGQLLTSIEPIISFLVQLPLINIISQIAHFTPVISVTASLCGIGYFLLLSVRGQRAVKSLQQEIDWLNADYSAWYTEIYQALKNNANNIRVNAVGQSKTELAELNYYLEARLSLEQAKSKQQEAKNSGIFWTAVSIISLSLTVLGIVALLTPAGPIIVSTALGALAVSTIIGITTAATSLFMSVVVGSFYVLYKNKYAQHKEQQFETMRGKIAALTQPVQPSATSFNTQQIQSQLTQPMISPKPISVQPPSELATGNNQFSSSKNSFASLDMAVATSAQSGKIPSPAEKSTKAEVNSSAEGNKQKNIVSNDKKPNSSNMPRFFQNPAVQNTTEKMSLEDSAAMVATEPPRRAATPASN